MSHADVHPEPLTPREHVAVGSPPSSAGNRSIPWRRSAFVAAGLGWLVPGLGHVYVGKPGKGLYLFVAIAGLFGLGLYLTGGFCINPDKYALEFIGHALIGGPTALILYLTEQGPATQFYPHFDVGRLYCPIAGLLNVVAICDALGYVLNHNRMVKRHHAWQQQREYDAAEQRRIDAAALDLAQPDGPSPSSESP